jgi:hypothetical protein
MDEQNLETQPKGEESGGDQNQENSSEEKKLNPVLWIILIVGAATLDLFQAGISVMTAGTLGTIINFLIDILVGMSLALFFALKGILDWRLGFSLILGFAAEFFTGGIAPAWLLDILYAFIITDGKNFAGMVPVIGETAREAALAVMSKGKSVEKQAARTNQLKERDKTYMSKNKAFNKNNKKDGQSPEGDSQTGNSGEIQGGGADYSI